MITRHLLVVTFTSQPSHFFYTRDISLVADTNKDSGIVKAQGLRSRRDPSPTSCMMLPVLTPVIEYTQAIATCFGFAHSSVFCRMISTLLSTSSLARVIISTIPARASSSIAFNSGGGSLPACSFKTHTFFNRKEALIIFERRAPLIFAGPQIVPSPTRT